MDTLFEEKRTCKSCNKSLNLNKFTELRITNKREFIFLECNKCRKSKPDIYLKKCRHCNKISSIINYCKLKTGKNGLSPYCVVCRRAIDKKNRRYVPKPEEEKKKIMINKDDLNYTNKKEYMREYMRKYNQIKRENRLKGIVPLVC